MTPMSRIRFRWKRSAVLCGYALLGALLVTGQTPPARPVTDGVYSAAQAARGQQLYKAQCASCHGGTMEGASGPPLVGGNFLANWSAQPLSDLVSKIQKTMPFSLPGSLSVSQSTDLAAFILQTARFPAGQADLNGEMLSRVVFPTVRSTAAPVAASVTGVPLPPPEGNLAELMRAIAFPNANIIFNVQLKDPGAPAPKKNLAGVPFDYVEWGSTVYPGWLAIDQAAIALTETAHLLLTPGRKCQNGRPAPVDRADWKQYVQEMAEVGKLAHRASRARDFEAFVDISEKLTEACANCHRVYRDKGSTEGSGALRCQPAP
jgi:mono/diheme cytochrome c family protein